MATCGSVFVGHCCFKSVNLFNVPCKAYDHGNTSSQYLYASMTTLQRTKTKEPLPGQALGASPLRARTLLVAPGISTSSKKLLGAKGTATRSKDALETRQQVSTKNWPAVGQNQDTLVDHQK